MRACCVRAASRFTPRSAARSPPAAALPASPRSRPITTRAPACTTRRAAIGNAPATRRSCSRAIRKRRRTYAAAIESARQLAPGDARNRQILALSLKLGPALIGARGLGPTSSRLATPKPMRSPKRSAMIQELFKAVWGLWMNDAMRQRFDGAGERAEELIALSSRLNDEDLRLEAIHCRWSSALFRGEASLTLALASEGAALSWPSAPADSL